MRAAIEDMARFPQASESAERKTRMPICDKHASNTAADDSFARDLPEQKLHRFNCFAHVGHKTANRLCDIFPNEKRGLLHSCLAYNFGGTLGLVKTCMKAVNRKGFQWFDAAQGPGSDDDKHREAVWSQRMDISEDANNKIGTGPQLVYLRRKRLWNGRYRRRGRSEHFCFSRSCCEGPDHCLRQMDEAIDQEIGPVPWVPSRFLKIEITMDWVLFWLSCHGILLDATEMAFANNSKPSPASRPAAADGAVPCDEKQEDEPSDEDEHAWHLPEEDLGLTDPLPDDDALQRQSTFRKNTLAWIQSRPTGRLTIFRKIMRGQQMGQRLLVEHSGDGWVARETRRRAKGERPTYRVVKAAQGAFHKPIISKWSRLMRDEGEWADLPAEYRRHDLSIHAFRGLNAAICNKYEMEGKVLEHYPFMPYDILDESTIGQDEIVALRVASDFVTQPCIMDPQWYAHCEEFSTPAAFNSADSKAIAVCRADEIELDNYSAEAANANIHRTIRRALQQKLASLEDVSANALLRLDRQIHTNLWGAQTYPPDHQPSAVMHSKRKRQRGGGGGVCRAFVSYMASRMIRDNGRADFSAIMAAYKYERAEQHSELLESFREAGKHATKARQQQRAEGQRWNVSSFGRVTRQAKSNDSRIRELKAVTAAEDLLSQPKETVPIADATQIVPFGRPTVCTAIAAAAGDKLDDQMYLFRCVARHKATLERKTQESVVPQVRKDLQTTTPFLSQDLHALQPQGSGELRTLDSGRIFDVFWHEDISSEAQSKVSMMCKGAPQVVKACDTLWKKEHTMITRESAMKVGPIPAAARPTFCHRFGLGLCLCKGNGLLAKLMADNLAKVVCSRARKESPFRRLLTSGFVVFHIGSAPLQQHG